MAEAYTIASRSKILEGAHGSASRQSECWLLYGRAFNWLLDRLFGIHIWSDWSDPAKARMQDMARRELQN